MGAYTLPHDLSSCDVEKLLASVLLAGGCLSGASTSELLAGGDCRGAATSVLLVGGDCRGPQRPCCWRGVIVGGLNVRVVGVGGACRGPQRPCCCRGGCLSGASTSVFLAWGVLVGGLNVRVLGLNNTCSNNTCSNKCHRYDQTLALVQPPTKENRHPPCHVLEDIT